ncbi:MAG: hypothetical protein FJ319_13950 [SAR202 cluster bacterium]|nr:hypothetical protein [SAR202 cluster bacterium]
MNAKAAGATTLKIDCAACTPSPAGFKEYLRSTPPSHDMPFGDFDHSKQVDLLLGAGGDSRIVLALDDFDRFGPIEGWIRDEFLGRMAERGIMVIITSLRKCSIDWTADASWRGRLTQLRLQYFGRQEADELLMRLGVDNQANRDRLAAAAQGLPLSLAVGAESMLRGESVAAAASAMNRAVTERALMEVVDPDLRPAIEALTVLTEADENLLGEVLERRIGWRYYNGLGRLSFVQSARNRLAITAAYRTHLNAEMKERDSEHHGRIVRKAFHAIRYRLLHVRTGDRHRSASLMNMCADALPNGPLFDLTGHHEMRQVQAMRTADGPYWNAQIDELRAVSGPEAVSLSEAAELLEQVGILFPNCIRVLRTDRDELLALYALVPLFTESLAMLPRSRIGSLFLASCSEEETRRLDCTRATADTYFALLPPAFYMKSAPSQPLIAGSLVRDFLTHIGKGLRGVMPAGSPEAVQALTAIGFQARKPITSLVLSSRASPIEMMELDLRGSDIGAWLLSLGHLEEAMITLDDPDRMKEEFSYVLESLDDAVKVGESALARCLGRSGRELQQLLRETLTSERPSFPLRLDQQEILRASCLGKRDKVFTIAGNLSMSRSTYYRKLNEAYIALAKAVMLTPG